MKLTLLCVFSLCLVVSVCGRLFGGGYGRPQFGQVAAFRNCTARNITLDDKMALIAEDNDDNKDGIITTSDLIIDVSTRYDLNGDGTMTEKECILHWSCRYGDSWLVAQYMCTDIMEGEQSVATTAFDIEPFTSGLPLDLFLQNARARYDTFENDNCTTQRLTPDQKVALNASLYDVNNDGFVTSQDIQNDLISYDTDNNGEVSEAEFVLRWVCLYGDTGDYARYLWDSFSQENPTISFDTSSPISVDQLKSINRQNYYAYARFRGGFFRDRQRFRP